MSEELAQPAAGDPVVPLDSPSERIVVQKQGAIGRFTFNNPARRNAISIDMWEAIPVVLDRFEADPDVRVVVLTGAGDKAFVAGADISQFEGQRSSAQGVQHYEEIAERAQERLQASDKPVIAAIRGYCLGAGINIALACDLRLASEDARFGVPAAKVGLGYRVSSTKNLVDTVGPAFAREMLLTARQFTADEAKSIGLVHRVVAADALEPLASDYCASIAANAPLTLRTGKRIIRELLRAPAGFDAAGCAALVRQCFESRDYVEGRRAFMKKRKPVFRGS